MIVGDISSGLFDVYNIRLLSYDCRTHHSCHKESRLKYALRAGRGAPAARIDSTWIDTTTIVGSSETGDDGYFMMPAQVASHSLQALHGSIRVFISIESCMSLQVRDDPSFESDTSRQPTSDPTADALGLGLG